MKLDSVNFINVIRAAFTRTILLSVWRFRDLRTKKATQTRLVKLTPGVNFINILRTHFLYKRRFSSYILALNKLLYKKFACLTLMKLTAADSGNQLSMKRI